MSEAAYALLGLSQRADLDAYDLYVLQSLAGCIISGQSSMLVLLPYRL